MNQSFLKVCTPPLMGNLIHTLLITLPSTLSPWPPSLIYRGTLHFPLHFRLSGQLEQTAIECQSFEHLSILKRIESLANKIFFSLPYKTKVTKQKIATSLDGNHLLQISSNLTPMDLLVVTLARPLRAWIGSRIMGTQRWTYPCKLPQIHKLHIELTSHCTLIDDSHPCSALISGYQSLLQLFDEAHLVVFTAKET